MTIRPFMVVLGASLLLTASTVKPASASEAVAFQSGDKTLHGFVYKPPGPGPFPTVLYNHGSSGGMLNNQAFDLIGPLLNARGWAMFAPYRRGQGTSSDAGPYVMDEIDAAQARGGQELRAKTLARLLSTEQLQDQLAALAWLQKQPFVRPTQIAVMGNSFGGIETVLGAEHTGYCAAVDAAGASETWADSPDLQHIMLHAARHSTVPIFFFQAQNDYDLAPSRILYALMKQLNKPAEIHIYPPYGDGPEGGHSLPYRGANIWIDDAVRFLNTHCKPTQTVKRWAPPSISSPEFESHAAFDPLAGELLFVRSTKEFRGWHILSSHCGPHGWTEPQPAAFSAPGLEADPYFTPDGRWLYFISTRATGSSRAQDLDIWRIKRDGTGKWAAPERLPEPVNSPGAEWFPRPAPDGWLYFGSNRPGGQGKTDIWRARTDTAGQWKVENPGPSINGPGDEYEALPSPDGKRLIIEADEGYFESDRLADGWSPRRRLGAEINENGSEVGAVFSPSGRTLLFARDIKGNDSGEFFAWQPDGPEDWPPSCPKERPG